MVSGLKVKRIVKQSTTWNRT